MIKSKPNDTAEMLLAGALAGLAATVPMTIAMEVMFRQLPARQRHPLPPRKITMRVARRAGFAQELNEPQRLGLTLAAHFGYGTSVGALYGTLSHRVNGPPVVKGMGYALLVWAVSYLGWLPVLGLISPATEHSARRNALTISAHLVWGATLGLLTPAHRRGGAWAPRRRLRARHRRMR
ncbi:MAG TPA: DUF1440 domain-containing protein [Tepidisphaeraceae bacterium]|nr:DUF1440 domain-containing protein [Tepidisphaeraceae bacterium]